MENHELETAIRVAGALLLVMCLIVLGWVIFLRATADKPEVQESPEPSTEVESIVLPTSAKCFALSPLYIISAAPEAEAWNPTPRTGHCGADSE